MTDPVVPVLVPVQPTPAPWGSWFRSILTDGNGDFDVGQILTVIVILTMCGKAIWAQHFDPQQFGIGVGAALGGLAAYKFGNAQRPPPPPVVPVIPMSQIREGPPCP